MNTQDILRVGKSHLSGLSGHVFDLLTVSKPISPDAAINLSKVVSKLSPLLGNLIEFNTVEYLNDQKDFRGLGEWYRQDPGFPDTVFRGCVFPTPGFEIKAWFPLATEITARFKDSQNHFQYDETYICMIAWLPEHLIYGKPKIIDVCVVSGQSVAKARDDHYHNPPDYIVLEPEDTKNRTRNLQQTNTNGYKFQGSKDDLIQAMEVVNSWGENGRKYWPVPEYQSMLRQLISRFPYRLDTNFAKMDRIAHPGIENFKAKVLNSIQHGLAIQQWARLLGSGQEVMIREALSEKLQIIEEDTNKLLR
ncbi:hypothetical protein [Thalassospira sp.]|uniref:hypothetical protein n=1 Tax=Thalassospira sp. TaxID=1912094 RepID=UPI003AA8BA93